MGGNVVLNIRFRIGWLKRSIYCSVFLMALLVLPPEVNAGEAPPEVESAVKWSDGSIILEYCDGSACRDALDQFSEAIGDARIVLVGEPWHGDGGAIHLRGELVEYLHKEHDFDVLVFEADFFSIHRAWERVEDADELRSAAVNNIYPFWSASRASESLWDYVASVHDSDNPLHVAGIDVRLTGTVAQSEVTDFLKEMMSEVPDISESEAATVIELMGRTMEDERNYRPEDAEKEVFFRAMSEMEQFDAGQDREGDVAFRTQAVRSIRSGAEFAWSFTGRDIAMAENLVWLMEHEYPGKKVVVASHNNHIITDKWMYFASKDPHIRESLEKRSRESIGNFTYLGEAVRRYYGPEVVSFPVIPYRGHFNADIFGALYGMDPEFNEPRELEPASDDSLEARLSDVGFKKAFVAFGDACSDEWRAPSRVLGYMSPNELELNLCRGFDGLFFLEKTSGLNGDF